MGACGGADPTGVVIRTARYLGCLLWHFGYADHRHSGIDLDATTERCFGKSKVVSAASGVASVASGSGSSITGGGGPCGGGGGMCAGSRIAAGGGGPLGGGGVDGGVITGGAPVAAGIAAKIVPAGNGGGHGGSAGSVSSSDNDTAVSPPCVDTSSIHGGCPDDDDADPNGPGAAWSPSKPVPSLSSL